MVTVISTSPSRQFLMHFIALTPPALMTVFRNEGRWGISNVEFNGERVVRHDKRTPTVSMLYIDYGLSVMKSEVLENFTSERTFDLSEV